MTFVDGARFLDAAGTGKKWLRLSKKLQGAESRGWGGTRGEEPSIHHSLEGMWGRTEMEQVSINGQEWGA